MKTDSSLKKSDNYKNKNEFLNLLKSFTYAFNGIWYAIKNERNMRIHICAAVFVIEFAIIYGLSFLQYAVLILTIGAVIAAELFNTALEACLNLYSKDYNRLIKVSKDVSAAAVLILAICSVFIAFFMFSDIKKLTGVFSFLTAHLWAMALFILEIIIAVIFVFSVKKKI